MPNGQKVLVQSLPLRAAPGDAERAERDAFERALSLASIELAAGGDPILAHRALGGDEDRTLVWLLPLVELARPKIRTAHELLGLAVGVATQLADRHQRGLTTPLLSEQTITAHGRIAGAQVFAAGPWLAGDVTPIRVAPEERALEKATASGDVWRLGQLLSELARHFALPSEISRMLHPDPVERPTAEQAIDQLDAAFTGVVRRAPSSVPARTEELMLLELPSHDTDSEEPQPFDEPLPRPPARRWRAPLSLALAGLSAGALLSLLPS